MSLKILQHPNPILRQKTKKIKKQDIKNEEIQKLIKNMIDALKKTKGIGLAAPQIGKSIKLILVRVYNNTYVHINAYNNMFQNSYYNLNNKILILINPKIANKSWKKEIGEEGCLSISGFFGSVKRSKKITVKALDKNGKKIKFKAENLFARIIQHEVDHLDGILFIDKIKKYKT
jgi:peptide deformylase